MQQVVSVLSQYATKEVVTVFMTLGLAWAGWKTAAKSFGLISSLTQKCSFLGLAATVLFLTGLGTGGYGLGEIATRKSNKAEKPQAVVAMSDASLLELAKTSNEGAISKIVDYARSRNRELTPTEHKVKMLAELVDTSDGSNKEQLIQLFKHLSEMEAQKQKETTKPVSFTGPSAQNKSKTSVVPVSYTISKVGNDYTFQNNTSLVSAEETPTDRFTADNAEAESKVEPTLSLSQSYAVSILGIGMAICGFLMWVKTTA